MTTAKLRWEDPYREGRWYEGWSGNLMVADVKQEYYGGGDWRFWMLMLKTSKRDHLTTLTAVREDGFATREAAQAAAEAAWGKWLERAGLAPIAASQERAA